MDTKKIKEAILLLIDDKMDKATIDKINSIAAECDNTDTAIAKLEEDYNQMKLDYVDIIRHGGGTAKYNQQDKPNPAPANFEDIMNQVIAKRK